jgi:hypothetical protein
VLIGQFPSPAKAGLPDYLRGKLPISLLCQRHQVVIAAKRSAETSKAAFFECIAIYDFSEDNEPSPMRGSLHHLNDVGLRNGPALTEAMIKRLREAIHRAPRGNIVPTSALGIEGWESRVFREGPFRQFNDGGNLSVMGRSEPIVLEGIADPKFFVGFDYGKVYGGACDVSPQLSFGRQIRASYEPLGRLPEPPSREPENTTRYSENYGPDGDDS